jgi:hypothetical protein
MSNDEFQMTKEARSPNDDKRLTRLDSVLSFGLGHFLVIRHSSFVIFRQEAACS